MLQVVNLSISYTSQEVLNDVTWHVSPKDRVGLIGNNGSGKSTLMKIIAGIIKADEGEVVTSKGVTFGYLPQEGVVHHGSTLFEEASSVFGDANALLAEEKEVAKKLGSLPETSDEYNDLSIRYSEIHESLQSLEAYQIEQKTEKILVGLGFKHEELHMGCDEFSGGWQMRIALAKVLLSQPNVLLLDEPTNYLDLEARQFLYEWLSNYPFAVIMVSHDRYFLDKVVTRITDIHDGKLNDYHCNYSKYLIEREERLKHLVARAERLEEEKAKIQSFIDRFRYNAKKAPMVQSRVKQLSKMETIKLPSVRKKIRFSFPQPERSGKVSIEAKELYAGYDGKPDVLKKVDFRLIRGEKVALVGINGAGKSTLMKVLSGQKNPSKGECELGHNVSFDYFAQDVNKQLDPKATVYETLERGCPFNIVPHLRNLLGAFLFSGDDIDKPVSVLSGGEKNRIALAKMLLTPSNLLLLDEPTNHLDIDAKDILLEALLKFEGTILFVSHDRYFLDKLATKVYALDNGELYSYPGTYPDFLEHIEKKNENSEGPTSEEKQKETEANLAKEERVKKYKEEKKIQREKERLTRKVEELEQSIADKENEAKDLLEQMANPENATNFSELDRLSDLKSKIDKNIEQLSNEWEESLMSLEEIED